MHLIMESVEVRPEEVQVPKGDPKAVHEHRDDTNAAVSDPLGIKARDPIISVKIRCAFNSD